MYFLKARSLNCIKRWALLHLLLGYIQYYLQELET